MGKRSRSVSRRETAAAGAPRVRGGWRPIPFPNAKVGWGLVILSLVVIFGPSLVAHMRLSADPGIFNDDVRQQVYPFFRYEEGGSFQNDFVGDYYLRCLPWGFRGLYMLGGAWMGAEALSKILPYFLLAATVVPIVLAAHLLGGRFGAFLAAAICLGSDLYLTRLGGGLPRGFGFPLLAATIACLAYGRVRPLAVVSWLAALFYPASAVPVALSLGGLLLLLPAADRGEAVDWSLGKRFRFLAVTAAVTVLLLLPPTVSSWRYGPVIRPADVASFPEIGPGGRYGRDDRAPFASFVDNAQQVIERALPGAGEPLWGGARDWFAGDPSLGRLRIAVWGLLGFALIGWSSLLYHLSAARRVTLLVVASFVGHTVARLVAPLLYLPQRYVLYPVPLLATVVLATGATGFAFFAADERRRRVVRPVLVGAFAAVSLLVLGGRGSPQAGLTVKVEPKAAPYEFFRSLPLDVLIGGWPSGLVNNVPYVARRAALVTYETHQAFHAQYALEMRRRTRALIDALFATTDAPLHRLREEFGVTHLLIDVEQAKERTARYFRPFTVDILAAQRNGSGARLAVLRWIEEAAVYRDERYAVLDMGRLSARP